MDKKQKHTLLIVDDEPLITASICRLVEDKDISLLTAENGEEALRLLFDTTVSLVLTDMCMPSMGGLELVKVIKKNFPETKVILMSGQNKCKKAQDAIKRGEVVSYITKPWDPRELLDIIDAALKNSAHKE